MCRNVRAPRVRLSAAYVKVKLNKTGRKVLRRLKKLKATFTVTVTTGTSKPVVRVHHVTLRQPKPRAR